MSTTPRYNTTLHNTTLHNTTLLTPSPHPPLPPQWWRGQSLTDSDLVSFLSSRPEYTKDVLSGLTPQGILSPTSVYHAALLGCGPAILPDWWMGGYGEGVGENPQGRTVDRFSKNCKPRTRNHTKLTPPPAQPPNLRGHVRPSPHPLHVHASSPQQHFPSVQHHFLHPSHLHH